MTPPCTVWPPRCPLGAPPAHDQPCTANTAVSPPVVTVVVVVLVVLGGGVWLLPWDLIAAVTSTVS